MAIDTWPAWLKHCLWGVLASSFLMSPAFAAASSAARVDGCLILSAVERVRSLRTVPISMRVLGQGAAGTDVVIRYGFSILYPSAY